MDWRNVPSLSLYNSLVLSNLISQEMYRLFPLPLVVAPLVNENQHVSNSHTSQVFYFVSAQNPHEFELNIFYRAISYLSVRRVPCGVPNLPLFRL